MHKLPAMKKHSTLLFLLYLIGTGYAQTVTDLHRYTIGNTFTHIPISTKASRFSTAHYSMGYIEPKTLMSGIPISSGPVYGYVVKLNGSGDTIWQKVSTCNFNATVGAGLIPRSIAVDDNDNLYIAGEYNLPTGTSTIDWCGYSSFSTSSFWLGSFIAKFDSTGSLVWAHSYSGYTNYNDIGVDQSGNAYVAASTKTALTFGSYSIPAAPSGAGADNYRDFVISYTSAGNVRWAKQLGVIDMNSTVSTNEGSLSRVAVERNGSTNFYLSGIVNATYTFGSHTFTSNGVDDAVVMKFDSSGNYINSRVIAGTNLEAFCDIDVNQNLNIALSGMFKTATTINGNSYTSLAGVPRNFVVSLDSALNFRFSDTCSFTQGIYPVVAIDDFNRVALGSGFLAGSTITVVNYLHFYDSVGVRSFVKSQTVPFTGSFPGYSPFSICFPNDSSDRLYMFGSYRPSLTADGLTVTAATSGNGEVVRHTIAIPYVGQYLPVKWLLVDAHKINGRNVLIQWRTASEINNQKFTVERSYDNVHYDPAGTIAAREGHTVMNEYTFTDDKVSPSANMVYYRIKQTDYDGVYDYSAVVSVSFNKVRMNEVIVSPNPVTNELAVSNSDQPIAKGSRITIADMFGTSIFESTVQHDIDAYPILVSSFKKGVYLLIIEKEGEVRTQKFIKE